MTLDPGQDPRLASLQLTVQEPGEEPFIQTVPIQAMSPGSFSFPAIAPATQVEFSLSGLALGGQVIAFGRSLPVDVKLGQANPVGIALRKPYMYVGGGSQIQVFDTVAPAGSDCATPPCFTMPAIPVASPLGIGALPDGRALLVETSGAPAGLSVVSTANHQPIAGATAALSDSQPGPIGLSPDGQWAAVPFSGSSTLDLIDLSRAASGSLPAPRTVSLTGSLGPAALSTSVAYAVENSPPFGAEPSCGAIGPSVVQPVSLSSAVAATQSLALSTAATDLILDSQGGPGGRPLGYLAEPCTGTVATIDLSNPGASDVAWAQVPEPLVLAQVDGTVYAAGVQSGAGAPVEVDEIAAKTGAVTRVRVPMPTEKALLAVSGDGNSMAEVEIKATDIDVYGLAVAPDGQHAVALAHVTYQSRGLTIGVYQVDDFNLDTYQSLLLDLGAGAVVQRVRYQCLFDDLTCPSASGTCDATDPSEVVYQDTSQFQPVGVSILDGNR
jgi:hypothetical protein